MGFRIFFFTWVWLPEILNRTLSVKLVKLRISLQKTKIYKLDDLLDTDAKGLVATVDGKKRNIFIVRKGEQVFAYLNWCPHNQVLIDQIPDKFFNSDMSYIQCSKHGALFQMNNGLCVEGPCEGEMLRSLDINIEDGIIYLVE